MAVQSFSARLACCCGFCCGQLFAFDGAPCRSPMAKHMWELVLIRSTCITADLKVPYGCCVLCCSGLGKVPAEKQDKQHTSNHISFPHTHHQTKHHLSTKINAPHTKTTYSSACSETRHPCSTFMELHRPRADRAAAAMAPTIKAKLFTPV